MVLFILGARNGNLLYYYNMRETKACTISGILLLRLASRIHVPLELKPYFEKSWVGLQKVQDRDTKAAIRERQWINDHVVIKQALTWNIQLRPNAEDLVLLCTKTATSTTPLTNISLSLSSFHTFETYGLFLCDRKKRKYCDLVEKKDFDAVEMKTYVKQKKRESELDILSISPPLLSLGPRPYCLCNHDSNRDIKFSDRFILIDWMFEVCLEYALELQTWFIAIVLLDTYIMGSCKTLGGLTYFQLIGAMSISLASQCCDVEFFSKDDVFEFLTRVFTLAEINNVEDLMLDFFKYQIWQENPLFHLLQKRSDNRFLNLTSESSLSELIFLECEKIVLFSQKKQIITLSSSAIEDYFGKHFEVEK